MGTTHRNESARDDIVAGLNDLIALDNDAIAAYEAAIERLDDAAIAQRFVEFKADHERHVRELSGAITSLGGTPKKGGDLKKILTKGRVVLASLGSDRQILEAMKSNEDETVAKYDKAVRGSAAAPPAVREILGRGLEDERRHRAWIEQKLLSI